MNDLVRLLKNESGVTAIEYGLIAGVHRRGAHRSIASTEHQPRRCFYENCHCARRRRRL